jgi:hypothetical protein
MQILPVIREVHLIETPLGWEVLHLQGAFSLWEEEEDEEEGGGEEEEEEQEEV